MKLRQYRDQIYSCLRCGFCFDHAVGGGEKICPPYATYGFESYGARGKMAIARALIDGTVEADADMAARVFACTECGACQEECFKYLPLCDIYEAMKEDLAEVGLAPQERTSLLEPLDQDGNPFGKPAEKRMAWVEGSRRVGRQAAVVFYAGCTPSYIRRGIARSTYQVLEAAGIEFALLGEEVCCGHPQISMGRPDLARTQMEKNIAQIEQSGADTVVFACPGCLATFRNAVPRLLGRSLSFETVHVTEFLVASPDFARLLLQKQSGVVTYHDPCTLGRGLGVFDAPRNLVDAVPGVRLVEMERTRERSYCCGNGAFVRYDHEPMAIETERSRLAEAMRTGADAVLSTCPACQIGLLDATRREKAAIEVLDVVEWIAKSL